MQATTSEYTEGGFVVRAPPDRTLRREVLKWIQGLDLSHSLRNVRRDCANGYIIAEICSRYFPTEISMHSYANGTSTKVKENNWDLIARFFVRTMPRIALDPGAIEGVMRGSPGFAVDMLEMLYTKFTLKKLSSMVPLMDDSSYGGPLDVSVQRDREVSLTGETSPGHRKPQTVTRGGTASAVKFQGIRTLPQETAAAARKRLAHGVTYEDAAAGIYTQ